MDDLVGSVGATYGDDTSATGSVKSYPRPSLPCPVSFESGQPAPHIPDLMRLSARVVDITTLDVGLAV